MRAELHTEMHTELHTEMHTELHTEMRAELHAEMHKVTPEGMLSIQYRCRYVKGILSRKIYRTTKRKYGLY